MSIWSSICSIKSFQKSNVSDLPKENMNEKSTEIQSVTLGVIEQNAFCSK